VVDGIDFSGGTLRTRMDGERLNIDEFTLQGAGGSTGGLLSATGFVQWPTPETSADGKEASFLERLRMEVDATAKALRVSARSDRRFVMSGTLSARLAAAKLAIRGTLKADQALFVMPEDSTPRLGDDVVVRKPAPVTPLVAPRAISAAPAPALQIQPDLVITLELGDDFRVRGSGLSTLLEGSLELRNAGRTLAPRLSGTIRTAQGTYKAYGQQLDIEEGVLRFSGPYDNPSLDILAIRPNLTQRVGVQISGTALSPVVRLYAEPDLPESEKLAWLVLGRSGANGGAESAMLQQAALALIGNKAGASGGIADAFGLDEISIRGASDSDALPTSGSTTPGATGATVTLGKRISRDFYVAYERSLVGTVGTLSIFYDLSRRFTLRGQTGEQSAVDLIFTLRYD
jgi:translocation and assembly module TamB